MTLPEYTDGVLELYRIEEDTSKDDETCDSAVQEDQQ